MKGLILAAGRGLRMGSLTVDIPKCLVRLAGRPLLDWQSAALVGAGIDELGIVTGYRAETLRNRGLPHFHNPHWATTNMVASLVRASEVQAATKPPSSVAASATSVCVASTVALIWNTPPAAMPAPS